MRKHVLAAGAIVSLLSGIGATSASADGDEAMNWVTPGTFSDKPVGTYAAAHVDGTDFLCQVVGGGVSVGSGFAPDFGIISGVIGQKLVDGMLKEAGLDCNPAPQVVTKYIDRTRYIQVPVCFQKTERASGDVTIQQIRCADGTPIKTLASAPTQARTSNRIASAPTAPRPVRKPPRPGVKVLNEKVH